MNFDEMNSAPATHIEAEASESIDPFAPEKIARILALNAHENTQIAMGETNHVEFKESFVFASLKSYAKTMAAFANTKGGYIVFGVKNQPKIIVGLQSDSLDKLDAAKLTGSLNDLFSPKISFRKHVTIMGTTKIGFIYTFPSIVKPVMAKHDYQPEVKEGEIYYRYEARTEKIKYPELRSIIDDQRRRETELWLKYMSHITKMGVDNISIVSSSNGEVIGSSSRTTFLDEKTLEQIQFVNEGQLHESDGEPTLKLVGDMQEVPLGIKPETIEVPIEIHVDRPIPFRSHNIVRGFLEQKQVNDPEIYIEQLCFSESSFLPLYYFGKLAKLNHTELAKIIESTKVPSPQIKRKLLQRLGNERENYSKTLLLDDQPKSQKKQGIYKKLLNESLETNIEYGEVAHLLQTIRCLTYVEIKPPYLFPIIQNLYEMFYTVRDLKTLANDFRKTLCHLDCVLYQDDVRI